MSIPNPSFQGGFSASWDNAPYLDDASNLAILGPKPLRYDAGGAPVFAAPVAAVASSLGVSTQTSKTLLYVGLAIAAYFIVPKLLKKSRK